MMRDIGKNIRDLRQQKHLTQEELAEQLFVPGRQFPTMKMAAPGPMWIRTCG